MPDKTQLRRDALAARDAEPDRSAKSRLAGERLRALEAYRTARIVCWYVGVKSEVATLPLLARALAEGKRTVVPACEGDELRLVEIVSLDELVPARFGLYEPEAALCAATGRWCPPERVDLFVVPGVAFDRSGGRIGYGRGFYDRLLVHARPDAAIVGLAFECQLVASVPVEPTDVPVQRVVTEEAVY